MPNLKGSVEVTLVGGVGNQLFGYVAGLYYSVRHRKKLILDVSNINQTFATSGSSILNFKLIDSVVIVRLKFLDNRFFRLLKTVLFENNKIVFRSESNDFETQLETDASFSKLQGYFQNYKYLQYLRERDVDLGLELRDGSKSLEAFMVGLKGLSFVSVHVRRGDYLKFSQIYRELPKSFYEDAMKHLKAQGLKFEKVLVFSDDIFGAKQLLSGVLDDGNTIWMDSTTGLNDVEMMHVMSLADACIIANSTFSYWGAIMGNQKKHVVAPKEWFVSDAMPSGLFPEDWVTLPR